MGTIDPVSWANFLRWLEYRSQVYEEMFGETSAMSPRDTDVIRYWLDEGNVNTQVANSFSATWHDWKDPRVKTQKTPDQP